MKKILILLILNILVFSSCIPNNGSSGSVKQNTEEPASNVTLNVKWSGTNVSYSKGKFIHYDTSEIQVVLSKGDLSETIIFERTTETEVSRTLKNIETGIWTIDVTLEDSNGEIANKQETVIIVEGSNNINIVMNREDYNNNPELWEIFSPDFSYNYTGSFYGIHAIAALGIQTISINLTDKLGDYETFLPEYLYLPHFDDSTDSNWIAEGTGIVGTVTFTYDSDKRITQAIYENISDYTCTTNFTYDSLGELETEQTIVSYADTEQSNTTKTYSYTDALITSIISGDEEITFEYSDGKLSLVTVSENDSTVYTEEYSKDSDDNIIQTNYTYATDKYTKCTMDLSASEYLHAQIQTYTGATSPSDFADAYYYNDSNIEYSFSSVDEAEKIIFDTSNSQISSIEFYYTSFSIDEEISSLNISYNETVIDI